MYESTVFCFPNSFTLQLIFFYFPGYCRKPLDGEDPDTKLKVLLDNDEGNLWTEPTSNRKVRVIVKSTDDTSEVTIRVSAVSITTTNGSPPNNLAIDVLSSSDGSVERNFTAESGQGQPSGMYELETLTGLNEVYFDITLPDDYNVADSQLTVTFRGCIETGNFVSFYSGFTNSYFLVSLVLLFDLYCIELNVPIVADIPRSITYEICCALNPETEKNSCTLLN